MDWLDEDITTEGNDKARPDRLSISRELRADAAGRGPGAGGEGPGMPDFAASILSRCEAQRAFVSSSTRRLVCVARLGLGVAAIGLVLVTVLIVRYSAHPEAITGRSTPVGGLVRSVSDQSAIRFSGVNRLNMQGLSQLKLTDLGLSDLSMIGLQERSLVYHAEFVGPQLPLIQVIQREHVALGGQRQVLMKPRSEGEARASRSTDTASNAIADAPMIVPVSNSGPLMLEDELDGGITPR